MKQRIKRLAAWALPLVVAGGLLVSGCQGTSTSSPVNVVQNGNGTSTVGTFGRLYVSTTGQNNAANEPGTINAANLDSLAIFAAAAAANNTIVNGQPFVQEAADVTGAATTFNNPQGTGPIAGNNQVIVADAGNGTGAVPPKIDIFAGAGNIAGQTNQAPAVSFTPVNLAAVPLTGLRDAQVNTTTGLLFVADTGTNSILVYNNGVPTAQYTQANMIGPVKISVDGANNRLYVAGVGAVVGGGTDATLTIIDVFATNTGGGVQVLNANQFRQVRDNVGAGLGGNAQFPAIDFTGVAFDGAHNQVYVANANTAVGGAIYRFNNANVVTGNVAPDNAFRAIVNAKAQNLDAKAFSTNTVLFTDGNFLYVGRAQDKLTVNPSAGSQTIFRAGAISNQTGLGLVVDPTVGTGGSITNPGLTGASNTTSVTGISVDTTLPQ